MKVSLKRSVVSVVVCASCVTMLGCSKAKENSRDSIATKVERIEKSNENVKQDQETLMRIAEATMSFISETSSTISEYALAGDETSVKIYATGIITSEHIDSIEKSFDRSYMEMTTEKGRENCMDLISVYKDYMYVIERASVGDFSEEVVTIIHDVTSRIPVVTENIITMK